MFQMPKFNLNLGPFTTKFTPILTQNTHPQMLKTKILVLIISKLADFTNSNVKPKELSYTFV